MRVGRVGQDTADSVLDRLVSTRWRIIPTLHARPVGAVNLVVPGEARSPESRMPLALLVIEPSGEKIPRQH